MKNANIIINNIENLSKPFTQYSEQHVIEKLQPIIKDINKIIKSKGMLFECNIKDEKVILEIIFHQNLSDKSFNNIINKLKQEYKVE